MITSARPSSCQTSSTVGAVDVVSPAVGASSSSVRMGGHWLRRFAEGDPIGSEGYVLTAESAAVLGPDSMVH
jgi:hypothetical protein